MAIKKLSELPKGKRATPTQIEKAIKAKPIDVKGKIVSKKFGRIDFSLGSHKKEDVAGVVKGFRRKIKADFGIILKDKAGNILGRTHVAKGSTTIPEQLAVKLLAKYAKQYDEVRIIAAIVQKKKRKKK